MTLRYSTLLFDLDGTLVDSYAALADAVNYARREHAYAELSEAEIRRYVGDGLEKLLQRAFATTAVPRSAHEAFERRYDEICCRESRLLPHVAETLDELAAMGVAMAVCTNKPTGFSRKILEALQLARHFRAIVGPDLAGARKPEAAHVLRTLSAMDRPADRALFVGDMPVDVEAARNSGIEVAVVATGSSSSDELAAAAADHYLSDFAQLVWLVRSAA